MFGEGNLAEERYIKLILDNIYLEPRTDGNNDNVVTLIVQ
jgi:hypothetical protein